ncbi:septum site-determining protein MinD [candidate division KSB3 bacterium]|jgi:septum site-determining protein MinD|uniref:Septum site-determining protein MinD n=1 Tax=candidate division KSB3 bacterium TaxID=2044937 RepID=A0A9D5Q8D2_9BACT|nr:septum site-determining protein MinD [candidate division KSB3 bacterium]MBD3326776.1 septum site-determining protein MinD [candidate division KSB3 bacterium]
MAGKVFVITSGKGGVGKSTNTANLGTGLAMLGRKVVVVDADIGLRNLDMVLGLENRIVYDLVNVVERTCKISQALIRDKRHKNLFLLPAAQTRNKEAVSADQMIELTEKLRKVFDYVLIDCPAGIETGFHNAVIGADMALLVTTPEVSAVRDVDRVVGLLEASGKRNPKLIINRLNPDLVKRGDMLDPEAILQILAVELIGIVPEDNDMVAYTNRGEPAILSKKSLAGKAFRNIVRRIEGETVEFLPLNGNRGLFHGLKRLVRLG